MSRSGALSINYLLEDTALFGGVKVLLHHANLLHRRGHLVRVISRGPRPDWYGLEASFDTVGEFNADTVPQADLNVATFWTTIVPAASLPSGKAVHYCQGFEASGTHNRSEHSKILEAYSLPLPAFAVSNHLADLVRERFGRPVRKVPPALEPIWRPRRRLGPRRRPRVLVLHPFEFYLKGVDTALETVAILRDQGFEFELVRISQWPLSRAESDLVEPDEFLCHLEPVEVALAMAGCDLLLAPSWEQEGFGLPVLEAMACGVPVVASRIDAYEELARDAAELVPVGDAGAFAVQARAVLEDWRRWRRMRHSGLNVACDFEEAKVAVEVESAMRWAIDVDGGRSW